MQSIVIGFLAAFGASLTEYVLEGSFIPENLLILVASSVTSASITSILLGVLESPFSIIIETLIFL